MSPKSCAAKPTVLTLTLPDSSSESKTGSLLVQRGDVTRVHQFTYERVSDLTEIIADALVAFPAVEADLPGISELAPPESEPRKRAKRPAPPAEPTVDVPVKKGKRVVRISCIRITGGEMDAAAYRQAVLIAGRLIDGKLWDGESTIRISDVYALASRLKHLTDRELSLFTLADFVRTGEPNDEATSQTIDDPDDGDKVTVEPPTHLIISSNGHHHANGDTKPRRR